MNIFLTAMIAGTLGIVIGGVIALLLGQRRSSALQRELETARTRNELLAAQIVDRDEAQAEARAIHAEVNARRERAEKTVGVLEQKLADKLREIEALGRTEERLTHVFQSLGSRALQTNNEQFLQLATKKLETFMVEAKGDVAQKQQAIDALIKPIRELLEKQNVAVGEIEKKREVAYRGLEEQIRQIASANGELRAETGKLVSALRRPEQRGRWGELQLRNAVELAGMSNRCDFDEQVTAWSGDGQQRPDLVVHLPGHGVIPVDAKVALDAYLDALECDNDEARRECIKRHAAQVQRHYKSLAQKQYWECFEHAPKLVVMFMPLESALTAALEEQPDLHAQAMQNHVLIATPTLLIAMLRAVAYGWQQEAITTNAREIAQTGAELHGRIAIFLEHFSKVGKRMESATDSFNRAVGSLEGRVLPSARKLRDLHATTADELQSPSQISVEPRRLTAEEFVEHDLEIASR